MSKISALEWWKSIVETKQNLLTDEESIKNYEPFLMNRFLSYHLDCVLLCNEMNLNFSLPKESQYLFYLNSIRKRRRKLSSFFKKDIIEDLNAIKQYYNYNNEKALQTLKILRKDQINYIKNKINIGGLKK